MKKIILFLLPLLLGVGVFALRWNMVSRASSGWQQDAGPLGGTVTKMLMVSGNVWAALYSGGIYQLNGTSWSQIGINHGLPENRVFDIVQDSVNTQNVYAGQMIACAAMSSDRGANWSGLCDGILTAAESPNFSSHALALDPNDPNTLYLPGHRYDGTSMLLVSPDGGATWEKRYEFPRHLDFNHLVFFNGTIYLGTRENGVYTSTDQGTTWTALNTGLDDQRVMRLVAFKNRLYLVGGLFQFNVREGGSLYRLSDDGTSWAKVSGPENVTGGFADLSTLWVGGEGATMWKSTDGSTFTKIAAQGLPASTGFVGEIVVDGSTIYAGMGGSGVFRSTNAGATFKEFNNGLKAIATREVHVNPKNAKEIYVITWDRLGMYYSNNAGKSFSHIGTNYTILTIAPDPKDFHHFYAAGDAVHEATKKGKDFVWAEKKKPGPKAAFIKSLAVHPKDPAMILAGVATEIAETPPGSGLYYSMNAGKSWKHATGIGKNAVHSILFHPTKTNTVYAAALAGGVYKSTNGGKSFSNIGGDALKYSYRLAMNPSNPNHLVAGSQLFFAGLSTQDQISGNYGGLFQTLDAGKTWTELTAGIRAYDGTDDPDGFQVWKYNFGHLPNYEQILIDPKNPQHITVGHHGESVVSTADGGSTWTKQSQGMIPGSMHNYGYCLGQSKSGTTQYACTCGRGLFSGTVSSATGQVVWQPTKFTIPAASAEVDDDFPTPKNVAEARQFILTTDEYTHKH